MEQGKHFAQTTEQNSSTKAQSSLSPSPDPAVFVLVLYQLMHAEFQKAEIHAWLGAHSREIRNQKDEALSGIFIAMEELQQAGRSSENIDRSKTWTQRLQIAPNLIESHCTSIPSRPQLGQP